MSYTVVGAQMHPKHEYLGLPQALLGHFQSTSRSCDVISSHVTISGHMVCLSCELQAYMCSKAPKMQVFRIYQALLGSCWSDDVR